MFNAIFGMGLGLALGLIEQDKRRRETKIRITGVNTTQPGVKTGPGSLKYHSMPYEQRMAVLDYLEELRQQAK